MIHEPPQNSPSIKWVRIPLITSDSKQHAAASSTPSSSLRRRSTLPSRLGPWPLKRSLNEDDCMAEPTMVITGAGAEAVSEKSQPATLVSVLNSIDEECRTIDQALKLETSILGSSSDSEQQLVSREDDKTMRDRQLAAAIFLVVLAVGVLAMFVSVPILTFVFAQPSWGGIQLPTQAPSSVVFGVALGVLCLPAGMVWPIAIAGVMSAKKGWPVLTRKNAAIVGGSSVGMGALLTGWVLAWVLPLLKQAEVSHV